MFLQATPGRRRIAARASALSPRSRGRSGRTFPVVAGCEVRPAHGQRRAPGGHRGARRVPVA